MRWRAAGVALLVASAAIAVGIIVALADVVARFLSGR